MRPHVDRTPPDSLNGEPSLRANGGFFKTLERGGTVTIPEELEVLQRASRGQYWQRRRGGSQSPKIASASHHGEKLSETTARF